MQKPRMNTRSLAIVAGLYALAISAGLQIQPASAQDSSAAATAAKPQTASRRVYYVDFRARTAASYGHAFVWYGRSDQKQIEVAGLHPASDSVVPYILGHVVPVPAETGKSYGDLDEQYLTASYRVYMTEAQGAGSVCLYQAPAGDLAGVERRHVELRGLHPGHRHPYGPARSVQPPAVPRGLGQPAAFAQRRPQVHAWRQRRADGAGPGAEARGCGGGAQARDSACIAGRRGQPAHLMRGDHSAAIDTTVE